jgi:hypothetical protein
MREEKPAVCFWGIYCSHAILTDTPGVYHCPFGGACFRRVVSEKK